jgi:hypothetical protein
MHQSSSYNNKTQYTLNIDVFKITKLDFKEWGGGCYMNMQSQYNRKLEDKTL